MFVITLSLPFTLIVWALLMYVLLKITLDFSVGFVWPAQLRGSLAPVPQMLVPVPLSLGPLPLSQMKFPVPAVAWIVSRPPTSVTSVPEPVPAAKPNLRSSGRTNELRSTLSNWYHSPSSPNCILTLSWLFWSMVMEMLRYCVD